MLTPQLTFLLRMCKCSVDDKLLPIRNEGVEFFERGIALLREILLPCLPAGIVLCGIAEFAFDDRLEFVPLRGELCDLPLQFLLGFTEGGLFGPEGEDRRDPLPEADTQEQKPEDIADDLLQKIRVVMPTE